MLKPESRRRRKWVPSRVKRLLRQVEPNTPTYRLMEFRDLLNAQIIRDKFTYWGQTVPDIAKSMKMEEREVYDVIRAVAEKARV
jgi:hypothetical protein